MEWWQAAILGLVEGITEYLPVSSTGHLIIASALMGLDEPEVKSSVDAFNIVIQGGAILAVLGLYRDRVFQMLRGLVGKSPAGRRLLINLVVAFLPAAVLGLLLDDLIESHLFSTVPVIAALALGGVYMIVLDRWKLRKHRKEPEPETENIETDSLAAMTVKQALFIGFMQCLAMWPGTSRSMMTITAGVIAGLKPKQAAEFSFLLGLPTLGGACVYKLAKNIIESERDGVPNIFEVFGVASFAAGLIVATVSAAFAVKWLVGFLNKHGLEAFGWYRIVLAIVLGSLIATGVVSLGGEEPVGISTEPAATTVETP
ncbi:MAG: undecaprenyl-diphosphate phosphatase [Planctomycetota bacterium]